MPEFLSIFKNFPNASSMFQKLPIKIHTCSEMSQMLTNNWRGGAPVQPPTRTCPRASYWKAARAQASKAPHRRPPCRRRRHRHPLPCLPRATSALEVQETLRGRECQELAIDPPPQGIVTRSRGTDGSMEVFPTGGEVNCCVFHQNFNIS